MSTQVYAQSDDGETGPFSHDELLAAVLLGELTEDDQLRSEGSTLWVSARRVKGLFSSEAASVSAGESSGDERSPTDGDGIGVPSYGAASGQRGHRKRSTVSAAQAAYDAQVAALQSEADGQTESSAGERRSSGWWRDHVGWEVMVAVGLMLAGIVYSVFSSPESMRFPLPRNMGGQAAQGYEFFGTGPWSTLEYALLWFDTVLVIGALLFGRRLFSGLRE